MRRCVRFSGGIDIRNETCMSYPGEYGWEGGQWTEGWAEEKQEYSWQRGRDIGRSGGERGPGASEGKKAVVMEEQKRKRVEKS